MSDIQSMLFMHKLVKKYSGHTLKEQMLARKDRRGKIIDKERRFAGILPEEQLKAMGRISAGDLSSQLEYSPTLKEDHYIRKQYDKRNSLIEEVNLNEISSNSK